MNTSKHAPKKPKELDLRYANPEAQAYVREQAIRLHHEGWTNVDIAKHFNVHPNTVGKWLKRARSEGVENAVKGQKRGRRENTQSFLSDEQKQQLLGFITDQRPTDFGIQHSLWQSSTIRLLIKTKFGIEVAKSTLCRWLNSVGLSYQRPVKRSIQQDETKVQEWLNTTYPALVKRAAAEKAVILWQDETALKQDPNWIRGWGYRGETPVLLINGRARYGAAVMQVAVNNRGKLLFSIQSKAVDAEDFRDFLIGIRNEYDKERKIIVVCDNASIHKAKVVKDWIADDGNFELAFIPPYSPELNPVEVFNQVLKVKMRMAPAMTQAEAQTFAQEQAQAMKQGKGAGVRKCFERDTVKYATYRESQKHLKDKE